MLKNNDVVYTKKSNIVSDYIILLNNVQIHNKNKYLLVVGQDLKTKEMFKFIDTHGMEYELYKYCDNWAQIKKGDIIRVSCVYHDSKNCNNVLRVRSDYELIKSVNYYEEIENTDSIEYIFSSPEERVLEITNFKNLKLDKKHNNKYTFALVNVENVELIKYIISENKSKYQLNIPMDFSNFYADIQLSDLNLETYVGQYYSGFILMQFAIKNGHIRAKIYDMFINDKSFIKDYNLFDDLPF